ncbi:MAG: nucleotidyltransferase family protein [Bacteroidales bacterium]|nr:nucleotidyltransferase family protein [Bacteroidales bacterium]
MNINDQRLLSLVKNALWNMAIPLDLFMNMHEYDWEIIFKQAVTHGVMGIAYDGLCRLSNTVQIPIPFRLHWAVNVDAMEKRYQKQLETLENLASFYTPYGIKILLLKGIGLSRLYPIPSHREGGDIDIYLFGDFEKGNRLMEERGIKVYQGKSISPKHSIFYYHGIPIENHQFFLSFNDVFRKNKFLEIALKEEAKIEHCESFVIGNQEVFLPSPAFNAIYVSSHLCTHLIGSGLAIRHLIDWTLFLNTNYESINFKKVYDGFKKANLAIPLQVITSLSFKVLEISEKYQYPFGKPDEKLNELLLERSILHPRYVHKPKDGKCLKILLFKMVRLKERFYLCTKLVGKFFAFEYVFYILKKRLLQPKKNI